MSTREPLPPDRTDYGKVTRLGIVAHSDAPGVVRLDRRMTVSNIASFEAELEQLRARQSPHLVADDECHRSVLDQPLPTPGDKLLVITDQRYAVAELRRRVAAAPESYTLLFGRVTAERPRTLSPIDPTRAALTTVASVPFISPNASLLLWPDAQPQDLTAFAEGATVEALKAAEPLRSTRAAGRLNAFDLPEAQSAPSVSASLFAFGW